MPAGSSTARDSGSAASNQSTGAGSTTATAVPAPASDLDHALLKDFSWRDLDGLGQFIGSDSSFLDMTFATPMSDSDHGTAGLDTMTDAWQDILWSGDDVIF